MAKYQALRDTWLSHENRMVKEGDEFETDFPMVNGKPMTIGGNLKLVDAKHATKGGKANDLV